MQSAKCKIPLKVKYNDKKSSRLISRDDFFVGMRDWVRQKEPKRFSEFGTQRYWSKPDLTFKEIE